MMSQVTANKQNSKSDSIASSMLFSVENIEKTLGFWQGCSTKFREFEASSASIIICKKNRPFDNYNYNITAKSQTRQNKHTTINNAFILLISRFLGAFTPLRGFL